jgi:hypothetical protein
MPATIPDNLAPNVYFDEDIVVYSISISASSRSGPR